MPMQFIQQFGGHSSVQQTEQYAKANDQAIWEYFDRVDLTTLRQNRVKSVSGDIEQLQTENSIARIGHEVV